MTPSLEGWPTKAKEVPSPHEVRLALLDTDPVYQYVQINSSEPNIMLLPNPLPSGKNKFPHPSNPLTWSE